MNVSAKYHSQPGVRHINYHIAGVTKVIGQGADQSELCLERYILSHLTTSSTGWSSQTDSRE
ncbi:MAG: hypothetical protein HY842_05105 [Bacteroidetes bacterium]|nr:hypothetical protein [Bacteroidota bacterium]